MNDMYIPWSRDDIRAQDRAVCLVEADPLRYRGERCSIVVELWATPARHDSEAEVPAPEDKCHT